MNIIWGLIIPAVGALFVTWGRTKSSFGLYRLLVARSRILWGDRVHGFYQIAGALCRDGLSDQEPTLRDRRRIEHLLECGRGESCPNSTG